MIDAHPLLLLGASISSSSQIKYFSIKLLIVMHSIMLYHFFNARQPISSQKIYLM